MTVHPGFGGQHFMPEVLPKLRQVAEAVAAGGHAVIVEVDGGIDPDTIGLVADAGATCFVAGNAVFGGGDPAGAVRRLRERAARPEEPRGAAGPEEPRGAAGPE